MISSGKIQRDNRGCPYSPEFSDIYASRDGAYQQARFVFLGGCGLPERWQGKDQFAILENGFGLGTNFLTVLRAWREDPQRCERLLYTAIEGFPLSAQDLERYCSVELKTEAKELAEKWPVLTPGVHQIFFDEGKVVLTLYFSEALQAAKQLACSFDAFFPDGFSPKKNPAMWQPKLLKSLAAHAREGSVLSTWCVASDVRRSFMESGFDVQKTLGFGHKSQMTVGRYAPRFSYRRAALPFDRPKRVPRSVLVIGAGLAGAAAAERLHARGLNVTIIDASFVPAGGASAIRWGVAHAQPSADDNFLFRLSRSGLFMLQDTLKRYPGYSELNGLFQMARDVEELARWQHWFERGKPFHFPRTFLRLADTEEVLERLGYQPRFGGLMHGGAGIVSIATWVRERVNRLRTPEILNMRVDRLERQNGLWTAFDTFGVPIASAESAVLSAAHDSARLSGLPISLDQWKGRLTLLSREATAGFEGAVTGPGYLIHAPDGWCGVGATYESADKQLEAAQAHSKNLSHMQGLFPRMPKAQGLGFYEGFRCVASDRRPVIGKVPHAEDLYMSCAMGSRGSVFCEIGARLIEAEMFGEPAPIEADLIKGLQPERLLSEEKNV